MALVKNPLMSVEARGTVAGIVFGKSKAGSTTRRWQKPARRLRPSQGISRSILGYLSRAWGALTSSQRASWEAWAASHPEQNAFGETFLMSGHQAYCKLNCVAVGLGGAGSEQDLPPADPPDASLATLSVAAGAGLEGDIDLAWTHNGTGGASDFNEILIAGPFQSPGAVEVHNRFKRYGAVAGNLLSDTISDLDVGFWYWVKVRYVDQYGQVTAELIGQATPKVGI